MSARAVIIGLVVAGLGVTAALSCQNSGGQILGPSGVAEESLVPTCQIPCETVEDCRKIKPKRFADGKLAEFPFVWLECKDGACVEVECIEDADCGEHLEPSYTERIGRPCVEHQCAPPCPTSGDCNAEYDSIYRRMSCKNGVCLMNAETPDLECIGDRCTCFSNDDCPWWTECRATNKCTERLAYNSSRASGKPCESDLQCGKLYVQQAMLERGLNTNLLKEWGICAQICGGSGDFTCGEGFFCVWVNNIIDLEDYPVEANGFNENRTERTACIPASCDKCENSLRECVEDSDCLKGEACVTTWGGCPGVCLNTGCDGCKAWIESYSNRKCISINIDIPISVRRPD